MSIPPAIIAVTIAVTRLDILTDFLPRCFTGFCMLRAMNGAFISKYERLFMLAATQRLMIVFPRGWGLDGEDWEVISLPFASELFKNLCVSLRKPLRSLR